MQTSPTEADARYLAEIRADCVTWLGAGAVLLDLRREVADDGVMLVARYRLGSREYETPGAGETVVAAHTALRARMLIDRIRFGFSAVVEGR